MTKKNQVPKSVGGGFETWFFLICLHDIPFNTMNKTFILLLSLSCVLALPAQEKKEYHNLKWGFSLGIDSYLGETIKPENVREYESYYDRYFMCGFISNSNTVNLYNAGITAEYFILKNRMGLTSGLKFTNARTYFTSDRDFFYWNLNKNDMITDYLSVKSIIQNNYFVGIPLEARFFMNRRELPVQFYVKVGYSFNFLINTDNKIDLLHDDMDKYSPEIEKFLDKPASSYSYIYPAFGLKTGIHRNTKKMLPYISVEMRLPGFLFNREITSFVKNRGDMGVGAQISVQFPLGYNVPIGSKYK